jgi:hypothetical protein
MKALLTKIQKVSEACKAIEKDMTVGKGTNAYKAVSDHSVILRVKEAEQQAGIVSIPIKQDLVSSDIVRFQKKEYNSSEQIEKINYVDVIKLTLRIYDIETDKFIDVESFGRGLDAGDKGFGKASTYARKYALLNAYKIATGEDPDANPSDKGSNIITPKEKTIAVVNYLDSNNDYKNEVLKHFGAQDISDLTEGNIITIHNNLTKKNLI